eukprot:2341788-Amphidinium_carterae.1
MHENKWLHWCLGHAVSFLTAILASLCLPRGANALHALSELCPRTIELLSVGKLCTTLLIPCAVHLLAHEHCCGLWTTLWEPCQAYSDILNVRLFHENFDPYVGRVQQATYVELVMSKQDVCAS